MNPGRMKSLIAVYTRGNAQNENGYSTSTRREICTVKAERYDGSTREVWEAYAAKERGIVNFRIRPCPEIYAGFWVLCDGIWHEIIAVQRGSHPHEPWIVKTIMKTAI